MGHLNRCLAYAKQLKGRARPVFFSLASAIEIIEEMGFEADYFVSHFWSANTSFHWNSELTFRFGLMLEQVQPEIIVFDGTWPFQGFLAACKAHGAPALVWSNRGLLKEGVTRTPVDEKLFKLIIHPGEPGTIKSELLLEGGGKRVTVPPVCLLGSEELLDREQARKALNLPEQGRFALFSLGPGNLKDVSGIGHGLIRLFTTAGFQVVWARAPISVRDVELPPGVKPVSVYPLARYLRAFDVFVGAAGYNSCCELVQSGIPALLVPNDKLADDQVRRARMVAELIPAVISPCETDTQRSEAVANLLKMLVDIPAEKPEIQMNGATLAAEAILSILD
ncbi:MULTISPECIES: glycosyltransferase [Nitrosomonas]|uniref:glycosyltransferase n=1 Tax=Nitrosomonas TaxID=914 RepID=UPI0007971C1B|nr:MULTISPECIES: glycosyltransferase [Nitrosomonas]KXK39380.1 MAG: glycosyltransferase [Nitrosomonas europaea]